VPIYNGDGTEAPYHGDYTCEECERIIIVTKGNHPFGLDDSYEHDPADPCESCDLCDCNCHPR
jgi:hypothetical protein